MARIAKRVKDLTPCRQAARQAAWRRPSPDTVGVAPVPTSLGNILAAFYKLGPFTVVACAKATTTRLPSAFDTIYTAGVPLARPMAAEEGFISILPVHKRYPNALEISMK